jgi:acyl carrier protein
MNQESSITLHALFRAVFPSLEYSDDPTVEQAAVGRTPEWDSMGQLSLLTAIEQEFGVRIPDSVALGLTSYLHAEAFIMGSDHAG